MTRVVFHASGGVPRAGFEGGGESLVLDDVRINDDVTVVAAAVPEASAAVMSDLVVLAVLGYGWRRKRAAA